MAEQTTIRRRLDESILDGGVQYPWYVNGHLLTATDLKESREAEARKHDQLAAAIGEGIVCGFDVALVTKSSNAAQPIVSVKAGLALNRNRQAVALPEDVPELALVRQLGQAPPDAGLFAACDKPSAGTPPSGAAAFVLTVSPSSGFRGKAPIREFGPNTKVTGCGSRYAVEGVRFRLAELDWRTLPGLPQANRDALEELAKDENKAVNRSLLRNRLAHLCFGTETLTGFGHDPLKLVGGKSPFATYGALDTLRKHGELTDCEVPIALLLWTKTGVRFVDAWAVRRRMMQPANDAMWPLHVGQRRLAEAEATFLQFQRQILDGLKDKDTTPATVAATAHYRFLPAAGYLPVDTGEYDRDTFFKDLKITTQPVDPAFLRAILLQSWYLDPIDLTAPPPIRVYESEEVPAYLVFLRDQKPVVVPAPTPTSPTPSTPTGPKTGQIVIDVSTSYGKGKGELGIAVETYEMVASEPAAGAKYVTYGLYQDLARAQTKQRGLLKPRGSTSASETYLQITGRDYEKIPKSYFTVTVTNTVTGASVPVNYVGTRGAFDLPESNDVTFLAGIARFETDQIPVGSYSVSVVLKSFLPASQQVTLDPGETERVSVTLVPDTPSGFGETKPPKQAAPGDWIKDLGFGKIYVIPKPRWPWPPPEERPDFEEVIGPCPMEVEIWKQEWGRTLTAQHPNAPVDAGGAKLYIDRNYTPDTTPTDAYAYLVFGDNGAYVPVLLAPTDLALPRDVPVANGGVSGLDTAATAQLEAAGVGDVDALAAGWSGLIEEALGVSGGTATEVISGARTAVDNLQGSLQIFTGVDATLADALTAAGFDGPVALANADPAALQAAVPTLTTLQAERLVSEARETVPVTEWSLGGDGLGLDESQVAGLAAQGITSQKALKDQAANAATKEVIANVLHVSTNAVDTLAGAVTIKAASEVKTQIKAAAPVTKVTVVDASAGLRLAALGVNNLGVLAGADVHLVAGVFGGDVAKAGAAIEMARNLTGGGA